MNIWGLFFLIPLLGFIYLFAIKSSCWTGKVASIKIVIGLLKRLLLILLHPYSLCFVSKGWLEDKTIYTYVVPGSSRIVLSVITVAAYDLARLKLTLDSFQGSCGKVEFIVVCPQEDIETISYLRSYVVQSDLQISVHHDEGIGVYNAMNQGVNFSTGDYLVFWNAGDTCNSTDTLSQFCSHLESTSPFWCITQAVFDWRGPQLLNAQNLKNFVCQLGGYISHQSVVVRKSEFMALRGFDTNFKVAADAKIISQLWRWFEVDFYELELVSVEFPNFSAKHNRLGRLENLKLCIFVLPWRFKLLSLGVALSRELQYAWNRTKKIIS